MLPEVPRQVLDALPQVAEGAQLFVGGIESGLAQVLLERLLRIDPLERVDHLGHAIDGVRFEAEDLADLARRAAAAVRDDVRSHCGAQPAVSLVDVLDHLLAPIAARQVEVDVRPLAAFLGEKSFEEQIHPDRVDRGDPEAVADGAIGRRPAPLREDAVLPAVIDDVPDDQEIAGEVELLDERQLAVDLRAGPRVIRPVALARTRVGNLPQERRHRLAIGDRVARKAVAQIRHRVLEAIRKISRGRNGGGLVREQPRHRVGGFQVTLRVPTQLAPR